MNMRAWFNKPHYPATVNVLDANMVTVDFVRQVRATSIAEIGIYKGYTSAKLAEYLDNRGVLHLFDFEQTVTSVARALEASGYRNVVPHANSSKTLDSYNWSLMRLLQKGDVTFDYAFLDGAHTWNVDALTFLLVDRLLQVGGHVDFDDYGWTLAGSASLNPKRFPRTAELYTGEQIAEQQVKLIVDILVRPDPRYREVVPNKIFQKIA